MIHLNSILENFNNCCKLPICVFNSSFQILNKYGHTDTTAQIMNDFSVISSLNSKDYENFDFTLTYNNNISFLISPYIFNIENPIFFLIGPFYTSDLNNNHDIATLPPVSFKYIKHLLSNLLDDIFLNSSNPFVNRTIKYIHSNYHTNISIDRLCLGLKINKCYFCNLFKKETGYTFVQFLTLWRVEKSKIYLKDPSLTLLDVSLAVGFNNQGYYSTVFKKLTGQTPSEYKSLLVD